MSTAYENPMDDLSNYLARFRGMSWAEISYLVEEEEEAERALAKATEMRALATKRRELFAKGDYELEEGEILE
jgi:hypothetical protein